MGDQVKGGSKGWGQVNRVEMGVGVEGWGWGVCGVAGKVGPVV